MKEYIYVKLLIYFICLVALWVTFIPAINALQVASTEVRLWFIVINVVISVKLLVDIHITYKGRL